MAGDGPGPGGSGSFGAPDTDPDETSDEGFGFTGQQGFSPGPSSAGTDTGGTKADPSQDDTISDTSVSGLGKGFGGAPTGPLGTPEADISEAIGVAKSAFAADEAELQEQFEKKYGKPRKGPFVEKDQPKMVNLEDRFQRNIEMERTEQKVAKQEESFPNFIQAKIEYATTHPVETLANIGFSLATFGISNLLGKGLASGLVSAAGQANTMAGLAGQETVGAMVASAVGEDEIGGTKGNTVGGISFGEDSPSTSTQSASVASSSPGPAPGPDSGPDGADFQRQRSAARINRAASNNATLAIAEEGDRLSTRQIREGRLRSMRRFA